LFQVFLAGLKDHREIHIVDVFADYQAAIDHHLIVVFTLIVETPPPRTIVGSLRDEAGVLAVLGLTLKEERP